jgi:cobalt transporter subunit CbtA
MIRRVLLAAILAGIAAGLVMSAVQQWRVVPLILEAERYEKAEASHSHGTAEATATAPASQGDEEWAPKDGFQRTAYTVAANVIAGVAFALLAAAASLLTGLPVTLGNGALWGLAGFAVFTLAPSAGLPPELPGMPAGDLLARQVWWWATAAATAGGIVLIALTRHIGFKVLAVALMAVPHLAGAPQPQTHASDVPAGLANAFSANVIVTSAIFWLVLGLALGFLLTRAQRQPSLA